MRVIPPLSAVKSSGNGSRNTTAVTSGAVCGKLAATFMVSMSHSLSVWEVPPVALMFHTVDAAAHVSSCDINTSNVKF